MADYPFILLLEETIAASSPGTLHYQAGPREEIHLKRWLQVATSTFNVTDIRVNGSVHFTNANTVKEIPSTFIPTPANDYNTLPGFEIDLVIPKGGRLDIDVEDTSGSSNVVTLALSGMRITEGG